MVGGKAKTVRPRNAATVDDYLEQLDVKTRAVLGRLRAQIKRAAPKAREVVSYQIPTYLQHGPLVHFAAQPTHLALYAISPAVISAVADELAAFEVSGRTIRFSRERPLPAGLVAKVVKARVRENESRAGP